MPWVKASISVTPITEVRPGIAPIMMPPIVPAIIIRRY